MTTRRHRPVRTWWAPWRKHCACGCRWYPCPDSVRQDGPPPVVSLGLDEPSLDELSDEALLRLSWQATDPARGWSPPPPRYTAAELIAMAECGDVLLNSSRPALAVGRDSVPRSWNAPRLTAGQRWRARDRRRG